jgi:hypothetical protein
MIPVRLDELAVHKEMDCAYIQSKGSSADVCCDLRCADLLGRSFGAKSYDGLQQKLWNQRIKDAVEAQLEKRAGRK